MCHTFCIQLLLQKYLHFYYRNIPQKQQSLVRKSQASNCHLGSLADLPDQNFSIAWGLHGGYNAKIPGPAANEHFCHLTGISRNWCFMYTCSRIFRTRISCMCLRCSPIHVWNGSQELKHLVTRNVVDRTPSPPFTCHSVTAVCMPDTITDQKDREGDE